MSDTNTTTATSLSNTARLGQTLQQNPLSQSFNGVYLNQSQGSFIEGLMNDSKLNKTNLISSEQAQRMLGIEQNCQAIPFIKFTQEQGKFEMNPEAEQFLHTLRDIKLGVVAVCGKYRTGKSYLMNKLFVEPYFQNNNKGSTSGASQMSSTINIEKTQVKNSSATGGGFKVSPTVNACTKGLWIWKKVIYSDQNQIPMIVIDTEGLGAYDEDENHDAKIFLLALLLSSLIIYNSVGTIDENALNNLSLVINLSKKIQLRNRADTAEDVDELASIFPSFLWVLRDFSLQLIDSEGNTITSRQYLENALKEMKGFSEQIEQKNRVRRLLKHFFHERDCCTMVRPTEDEKDLQSLAKFKDTELRKEFIDQMNMLKKKVMTRIKIKVMNGHQLNGPMILELANSYILALNQGQVPVIENAWTNVCNFEQDRAYKEAFQFFLNEVQNKLRSEFEEIGAANVSQILQSIKLQAFNNLKRDFLGDQKALETFQKKLGDDIKTQSKAMKKEFLSKMDYALNQVIMEQFSQKVEIAVSRGQIVEFEQLFQEIDNLLTSLSLTYLHAQDRLETLYRKYIHRRLPKLLDTIHSQTKDQMNLKIRFLEEKVRMQEERDQEKKAAGLSSFEELQKIKDRYEKERQELQQNERLLSQKVQSLSIQLEALTSQLERIRVNQTQVKVHTREIAVETSRVKEQSIELKNQKLVDLQSQVFDLVTIEPFSQYIPDSQQQMYTSGEDNEDELQDQINNEIELETPKNELDVENSGGNNIANNGTSSQSNLHALVDKPYIEQNTKMLKEILNTLNTQNEQISKSLSSDLQEILKNNQLLSVAIEQAEKRCLTLDKKMERKKRYENLVKSCQRLQCKDCNKLYTPSLFATHIQMCKKQQISLRQSVNFADSLSQTQKVQSLNQVVQNQEANETVDFAHEDEEILKIKILDLINVCIQESHTLMSPKSARLQSFSSIEFKFMVSYRRVSWIINRGIQKLKSLMRRTQRDKDIPKKEQSVIARLVLDIDRIEKSGNSQKIQDLVEQFFCIILQKLVDKSLPLNDKSVQIPHFVIDFIDFFDITEEKIASSRNQTPLDGEDLNHYQDGDLLIHTSSEEKQRGFNSQSYPLFRSPQGMTDNHRFMMDDHFNRFEENPNQISMQLDGDKSINEQRDNGIQYNSFFSINEDNKKNYMLQSQTKQRKQKSQNQSFYHSRQNSRKYYEPVLGQSMDQLQCDVKTFEKSHTQRDSSLPYYQQQHNLGYSTNLKTSSNPAMNLKKQTSQPLGSLSNRTTSTMMMMNSASKPTGSHSKKPSNAQQLNESMGKIVRASLQSPITSRKITANENHGGALQTTSKKQQSSITNANRMSFNKSMSKSGYKGMYGGNQTNSERFV